MGYLIVGVPRVPAVPGAGALDLRGGTLGTGGTLSERTMAVSFTVK
ncbi:hypothetical protein FHR71_002471 [Methylobacterium sp. RAS18]|nr:hypothetical protein [Methylobacterium sp. RAS18]